MQECSRTDFHAVGSIGLLLKKLHHPEEEKGTKKHPYLSADFKLSHPTPTPHPHPPSPGSDSQPEQRI